MPVHRFGWNATARRWFEWNVGLREGQFEWVKSEESPGADPGTASGRPAALCELPPALLDVLPDGYTVESSPAAAHWWKEAAEGLERGKLLTIDYGYGAGEAFSPARAGGTLRAYRQHRIVDDLLAHPGKQDITVHVDFAVLQAAGESAGLRTEQYCTQAQFLTRILQQAAADEAFAPMSPKQARQFQTLTHPEHLGRPFRVLVQAR